MSLRSSNGCSCLRRANVAAVQVACASKPLLSRPCRAYQQSQASNALQQSQQQHQQQAHNDSVDAERHQHIVDDYDMNYWHYQPKWLQPPSIIGSGIAFFVASLIFDDEATLKTAILAAGPVALYWGIFLFLLPRTFKKFAVDYIETHPEVEEQQQQLQDQQQKQSQQ